LLAGYFGIVLNFINPILIIYSYHMKKIITNTLVLLFSFLLINIAFPAASQKLPKVQNTIMRAPANVKIDGNATDWGNKFLAFNTNNRIYYTMANDDENLYLVLRTNDGSANEKAIFGITFTINMSGEKAKNSKQNIGVTYPTVMEVKKSDVIRNTITKIKSLSSQTTNAATEKKDSLRLFANKKIDEFFKEIQLSGISAINTPLISIYNTNGIKVGARLDNDYHYIYELAIPLKYLGTAINNGQKFSYNIKMNGLPEKSPGSPFAPPMIRPDKESIKL